jgi:hypothetical protein
MLTCVTDILSIDPIRATTGLAGDFDVAGVDWPDKIGSVRSGMTDIN